MPLYNESIYSTLLDVKVGFLELFNFLSQSCRSIVKQSLGELMCQTKEGTHDSTEQYASCLCSFASLMPGCWVQYRNVILSMGLSAGQMTGKLFPNSPDSNLQGPPSYPRP